MLKIHKCNLLRSVNYLNIVCSQRLCHSEQFEPKKAELKRTFTTNDVEQFAAVTGDHNPVHFDKEFVQEAGLEKPIVHGALINGLVSAVIGNTLPGPGTLVAKQTLNFPRPLFVGESVTARVEVLSKRKSIINCSFSCETEDGKRVMYGNATLVVKVT